MLITYYSFKFFFIILFIKVIELYNKKQVIPMMGLEPTIFRLEGGRVIRLRYTG